MRVAALLVAGGRGERAGGGTPKQFVDLGGGRHMLDLTIAAVSACPDITEVIVAVPADAVGRVRPVEGLRVVAGGARRQDSMAHAFAEVDDEVDVVVVHDAARPFVTARLLTETIAAAAAHGAAIAAVPVHDTVKRTEASGAARTIRDTLAREDIYLAQTPQAFRRAWLAEALQAAGGADVTDEAMLVERLGRPVHIVRGEAGNVKITTAGDLALLRARVGGDPAGKEATEMSMTRIGCGYDLHRLVEGRALILAGVRIPFDRGLMGHSDADIVCHAVTDALLGAAALGDIGRMFPDTDPRWQDADSVALLRAAVAVVAEAGFSVGNVDVTVIAERPKLLPYLDQMRANLAGALAVTTAAVSIKGKTNETVDATGRGDAMACHAVALLTTPAPRTRNAE